MFRKTTKPQGLRYEVNRAHNLVVYLPMYMIWDIRVSAIREHHFREIGGKSAFSRETRVSYPEKGGKSTI